MAAAPVLPASPASTPQPAPLSQGARIVNTFIAPSKTFTDLRRSASWWAPWLLIAIFSLLFVYAMGRQIGFEQISRNQVAHSSRAEQFDKLSPDQQAKQIQFSSKIIRIFAYASPVLILFFSLISTVVLWATFKIGAGAETSFGQAYAIGMYAGLPGIIGAILGTISLFAGVDPEVFDVNNPVGTNLAYYLDPATTGKFLRGMASALDLITIWSIVLIGIGYASTSKVKRSTAIWIVAVWYLVYKLATSGMAAAFS
jgi:Yip1-like protein